MKQTLPVRGMRYPLSTELREIEVYDRSSNECVCWSSRPITAVHSDGTFDVNFDSKFSTRTRVPVDDILPVPKQLMTLPCWLFDDVPGAGCL